jgi:hypothetical protein
MTLAFVACDETKDPVDVPFDGLDPSAERSRPELPPPSGTNEAQTSAKVAPKVKVSPGVGAVQACCAALASAARNAKDQGSKAVNRQAAAVCQQKIHDVRVGRVSKSQALSAVRGSLLGKAPGACR